MLTTPAYAYRNNVSILSFRPYTLWYPNPKPLIPYTLWYPNQVQVPGSLRADPLGHSLSFVPEKQLLPACECVYFNRPFIVSSHVSHACVVVCLFRYICSFGMQPGAFLDLGGGGRGAEGAGASEGFHLQSGDDEAIFNSNHLPQRIAN